MTITPAQVQILLSALEKIAETKYVDYSDAEDICREALAEFRQSEAVETNPHPEYSHGYADGLENGLAIDTRKPTHSNELLAKRDGIAMGDLEVDSEIAFDGSQTTTLKNPAKVSIKTQWMYFDKKGDIRPVKITASEIEAAAEDACDVHCEKIYGKNPTKEQFGHMTASKYDFVPGFRIGANFILEKLGVGEK